MSNSVLEALERLVGSDTNPQRIERLAVAALATLAFVLFAWALLSKSSPLLTAALLFAATSAGAAAAMRYVNYSSAFTSILPRQHRLGLVVGAAGLVLCIYLYAISEQLVWKAVAGLFLFNFIYQCSFTSLAAWRGYKLVDALRRAYAAQMPTFNGPPFVFVATSTPGSLRDVSVILSATTIALFRTKILRQTLLPRSRGNAIVDVQALDASPASPPMVSGALPNILRSEMVSGKYRVVLPFLADYDLAKYPGEFTHWVASVASTCMAVPSFTGRAQSFPSSEGESEFFDALGNLVRGAAEKAIRGNARVKDYALACCGPIVALHIMPQDMNAVATADLPLSDVADKSIVIRGKGSGGRLKRGPMGDLMGEDLVIPLVDLLSTTTLPLSRSDNVLPSELRTVIHELAISGLAPLADCYRRVRTAHSDVERFLALLECYEVLVKVSVIALQTVRWVEMTGQQRTFESIDHPSFGHWIGALRDLCKFQYSSPLASELGRRWLEKPGARFSDVVALVAKAGYSQGSKPQDSLLGFVTWLGWLRNATRGHGTVDERLGEALWREIQEAFLATVLQLKVITLESEIRGNPRRAQSQALKGWLRSGRYKDDAADRLRAAEPNDIILARGDELIEVFPFCALTGTEVLLWNSASGKHIHYSTHSNGMPRKLRADTLDPFTLWEHSRSRGGTVHFALLEDLDEDLRL